MRKFLFVIASIFLTSCNRKEAASLKPAEKIMAPIELNDTDYDSFTLNGKSYNLPLNFKDLNKDGFTINKNEYFHESLNKSQQRMVNLVSDGVDIGATFKNSSDKTIDTEDGTIIELYINNQNGDNADFSIHGLGWGTSYEEAINSLDDLNTDQAVSNTKRTLNYYTDDNLVSLYFLDDKLTSVAIFSKAFMRDQNYVGGEFVIFGQTVKFPMTIRDLEELLSSDFDVNKDKEDGVLFPGEEVTYKIYSPMLENLEASDDSYGIDFYLKNTSNEPISYEDASIVKLSAGNSSDLSVGNVYVGASVDELKKVDKKNQNPRRLSILGKNEDGTTTITFKAEDNTYYIFRVNEEIVTYIEILNDKPKEW